MLDVLYFIGTLTLYGSGLIFIIGIFCLIFLPSKQDNQFIEDTLRESDLQDLKEAERLKK